MRMILVVLLGGIVAGCGSNAVAPDPPTDAAVETIPAPATQPAPRYATVIDLSLYEIMVPAGAISQNKEFWKKIEPSEDEFLDKNGIRAGEGKIDDWPAFKDILDKAGANTVPNHYIAPSARDQEIAVSGELGEQTLFCFDAHGLSGHVYDRCQNLLVLGFEPAANEAGAVRVELCPMVRAMRHHYQYTVLNDQTAVDFTSDEYLYDVGLKVDLPKDDFLVVAPSPQSARATSIGHQFLTQDAQSGRRELVLIFVARPTTRQLR